MAPLAQEFGNLPATTRVAPLAQPLAQEFGNQTVTPCVAPLAQPLAQEFGNQKVTVTLRGYRLRIRCSDLGTRWLVLWRGGVRSPLEPLESFGVLDVCSSTSFLAPCWLEKNKERRPSDLLCNVSVIPNDFL